MKYIVILATNFMRVPRFVIVPYTCVSFVVAGIFVQMKSGGSQLSPCEDELVFRTSFCTRNL